MKFPNFFKDLYNWVCELFSSIANKDQIKPPAAVDNIIKEAGDLLKAGEKLVEAGEEFVDEAKDLYDAVEDAMEGTVDGVQDTLLDVTIDH